MRRQSDSVINTSNGVAFSAEEIAARVQHTLIAPGVMEGDVIAHCETCAQHCFNAAMVPSIWVAAAVRALEGTAVRVASAVDFPIGQMSTTGKVEEIRYLVGEGVDEIDVGVGIGLLKGGDEVAFGRDIARMTAAAGNVPVKAMLELPLLTSAQRGRAVDIAVAEGVKWVKNASSGAVGVATPEDVAFLRARAPESVGVKASGGITLCAQAEALLAAGAGLLGTSSGPSLLERSADHGRPLRTHPGGA